MKIAVRLDDITPDMDYEKFHKMKKILDTYQINPLIGVVPFNRDSILMKNPVIEDFCKSIGIDVIGKEIFTKLGGREIPLGTEKESPIA